MIDVRGGHHVPPAIAFVGTASSGLGDPEVDDEVEEGAGERTVLGAAPHVAPVDLLTERPRDLERTTEVEMVLGQRQQLADEQVVDRHHQHPHRLHAQLVAAARNSSSITNPDGR